MRRAEYAILSSTDALIVIRDLDGPLSVTNDAERVVADLLRWKGGFTASGALRRIHYYDTMGCLDELVHDGRRFTGFAPVAREDSRWPRVISNADPRWAGVMARVEGDPDQEEPR